MPRRAHRVLAAVAILALIVGCSAGSRLPSLPEALNNQPAELVTSFDGGFVVGHAKAPCGFPRHTELLLLDPVSGSPVWQRPVPWAPDGAANVGDVVVAAGRTIDGNPPSVAAADRRSGAPRWQRFLSSESLQLVGAVGDAVVVQADKRLLALDAQSGRVEWEAPIDEGTALVAAPPPAGPVGVGSTVASPDAVALFDDGGFIVAADLASGRLKNLGAASLAAVDGRSAFLVRGVHVRAFSDAVEGVQTWESELPLDHGYSTQLRLTAARGTITVVIGSEVGPNHRLVLLDAKTGDVRWQVDGVRDSTIANGVLVVERRHGSEPEGLTRQVLGRDLRNGQELWLRASSGVLGGYLGTSEAGPVFGLGRDALSVIDRVVRLDAATGKGTLGKADPLFGASEPDTRALVTDELIVLPEYPSTVTAFDGNTTERRWRRQLSYPMRSARVTNEGLLVATGDAEYGCD